MTPAIDADDELLTTFIDESIDALGGLPKQLDAYRRNPEDAEGIDSVFRVVHSIKGNAGFFELLSIKNFSHALENTLDDVRNGKVRIKEDLQRAVVDGLDILDGMLQRVLDGDVTDELVDQETELLAHVGRLANECRVEVSEDELFLAAAASLADEIEKAQLPQSSDWGRRVRAMISTGSDMPAEQSLPQKQGTVGPASSFEGATFHAAGEDVTEQVAGLLELFLATERNQFTQELGAAFLERAAKMVEWAEGKGQDSFGQTLTQAAADFKTIYDSPLDVDETLLAIVWDQLVGQLDEFRTADEQPKANADSTPNNGGADAATEPAVAKARLVRVKEEYLDEFLDDVSSLFITCERLKDLQSRMNTDKLDKLVEELRQINLTISGQTNNLQQSVVGLRKVPIRGLLAKFPRMARKLAAKLDKKINVHVVGDEIEIDKSLVENLDSPLTHMIRNVVDHGIEQPEQRLERGLDEAGNLWLEAELSRTHVVISVRDDGWGIDPDRLRKKAIEKGIHTSASAAALTDEEAIQLVFHAGLSTADQISEISGRGVGLDVVRTTLHDLGGDIHLRSRLGQGTTFRMEIPIRKAVVVVDGLLVKYGGENFVLPFEHIRQIVELDQTELKPVQGASVATIHGSYYGAASLGRLLHLGLSSHQDDHQFGVLIGCDEGSICLLVDQILGQRKVVVNNFHDILDCTEKISGAAELGGGRLALVLNAKELVKSAQD